MGVYSWCVVAMSKDEIKDFYPSQIGYRSLTDRTNIARKMMASFYPEDENNATQI